MSNHPALQKLVKPDGGNLAARLAQTVDNATNLENWSPGPCSAGGPWQRSFRSAPIGLFGMRPIEPPHVATSYGLW